jgi:hypothetical protein
LRNADGSSITCKQVGRGIVSYGVGKSIYEDCIAKAQAQGYKVGKLARGDRIVIHRSQRLARPFAGHERVDQPHPDDPDCAALNRPGFPGELRV